MMRKTMECSVAVALMLPKAAQAVDWSKQCPMENKLTLINVLFCYIPLGAVAIAVLLVLSAVVARVESEPADSDSRPPRSRRASRTTPAGTVDDVTAGPAPKGPELPAGTRLKKIELKGCRGIFEMLNCTLAVEPVSKMNDHPIFVGVATGPAIAGSDANVMEDFPVYCYKGKGDGSWRFTFEPQDMPKDRCCIKSEETDAKLPIDLAYMSTDGKEWYSDQSVCVHAVIEVRRGGSGRRADGSFKDKDPGPNNV